MDIKITLEDYLNELQLMNKQYGQEEELYPLVNMILRQNCKFKEKGLSLRDVHKAVRVKKDDKIIKQRHLLFGFGVFPDLAILDKEYNPGEKKDPNKKNDEWDQNDYMYGCIEIKKCGEKLFDFVNNSHDISELITKNKKEDCIQVICELLWFGNTIFTNGLDWYYLELEYNGDSKSNIREFCKKYIGVNDIKVFDNYKPSFIIGRIIIENIINDFQTEKKKYTFKVKHICSLRIEDKCSKNNIEQWNRLNNNLSAIDWKSNENISKFI